MGTVAAKESALVQLHRKAERHSHNCDLEFARLNQVEHT